MDEKPIKWQDWDDLIGKMWMNGASVAIGLFDAEGQLLWANPALKYYLEVDSATGMPKNVFVNPTFSDLSNGGSNELIFKGLMTIGNRYDVSFVLNAQVFRRNELLLVVAEADVASLMEENRKMSALNQLVNNLQRQLIKEKKTLEATLQELKETQQMLVHSEKMNAMGKLVAGVAHELNNPISFVYSNIHTLEENIAEVFEAYTELESLAGTTDHPEMAEAVKSLRKKNGLDFLHEDMTDMTKESKIGVERVKTIVEDLRTFSRLDEAEVKQVNLLENIQSTLTILRPEWSMKDIQLDLDVPEISLECYPGQLNQAIMNVLINAIQAVETGGTIGLSARERGDRVELAIQDNGCGIPSEIKKRIFDPFFTTKPVGSGTGLGLSITYKIINDLHHGSIEVESEPNRGTRFTLILPKKVRL